MLLLLSGFTADLFLIHPVTVCIGAYDRHHKHKLSQDNQDYAENLVIQAPAQIVPGFLKPEVQFFYKIVIPVILPVIDQMIDGKIDLQLIIAFAAARHMIQKCFQIPVRQLSLHIPLDELLGSDAIHTADSSAFHTAFRAAYGSDCNTRSEK